jgi:hypothetical protein
MELDELLQGQFITASNEAYKFLAEMIPAMLQ